MVLIFFKVKLWKICQLSGSTAKSFMKKLLKYLELCLSRVYLYGEINNY
jgi:hypothetical protein